MRAFTVGLVALFGSGSSHQDNIYMIDTLKVKGHFCTDNTVECQAVKSKKHESLGSKDSLKSFMTELDQCLYSAGTDCTAKISFEVLWPAQSRCVSSKGMQFDLSDFNGWMMGKEIELYGNSASSKKCAVRAQFGPISATCDTYTPTLAPVYDVTVKSDKLKLTPESEYDIVDGLHIWVTDNDCTLTAGHAHTMMTTIFHDAYTSQGGHAVATTPSTGQQTTIAATSAPTNAVSDVNMSDATDADFTILGASMFASENCVMTSGACAEFVKQHWAIVTVDQFKSIADLQMQCQSSSPACSTGLRGHVQFAQNRLCYPQGNANHLGLDTRLFKGFKLGSTLTLGVTDYASSCAKLSANAGAIPSNRSLVCPGDFSAVYGPGSGTLVRQNLPNYRLIGEQDVYLSDYLQISPIEPGCRLSINPTGQIGFDFLRVINP